MNRAAPAVIQSQAAKEREKVGGVGMVVHSWRIHYRFRLWDAT